MPANLAVMMYGKEMQTFCSTNSEIAEMALAVSFP